jgi:hypothetical protein
LSKRPAVTESGAFDWFDKLTNRLRHRANTSAYFVDHFQKLKRNREGRKEKKLYILFPLRSVASANYVGDVAERPLRLKNLLFV